MEENIYMYADAEICRKIGRKIKELRLRQNITQIALAQQSQISVSTIKKIENGEIGSFDSLMRVLRILGELDVFAPLLEEEVMSPNEYLKFVEVAKNKRRKRAKSDKTHQTESKSKNEEAAEW